MCDDVLVITHVIHTAVIGSTSNVCIPHLSVHVCLSANYSLFLIATYLLCHSFNGQIWTFYYAKYEVTEYINTTMAQVLSGGRNVNETTYSKLG